MPGVWKEIDDAGRGGYCWKCHGGKKICIHCQLEQIINCIDFVNDMLRDNLKELKNIINIIRLP